MITLENITDGIVRALHNEFHCTCYVDEIEQNLTVPAFLVSIISPVTSPVVGIRYRRDNLFNIVYFPQKENCSNELYDVSERLYPALEYITADGDLLRGTGLEIRFIDGILNATINYNAFVYKENERVMMEELQQIMKGKR